MLRKPRRGIVGVAPIGSEDRGQFESVYSGAGFVALDPAPARKAHGEVQFVELLVPPTSTTAATPALACVVETHSVRGATMRIELQSLYGLAELTRAFWSVR